MPEPAVSIVFFVLGTVVGSFLNVCIYRLPRDQSIVNPPSHCPSCSERLRPLDLIPLVSFLALGRKCRYCGAPITWRYFVVEAITGASFVAAWLTSQQVWTQGAPALAALAAKLVFVSIFIAIFFIDLEHMIIPDELVITGIAVGIAHDLAGILLWQREMAAISLPGTAWVLTVPQSLAGIAVGALFFLFVEGFSRLVFRKEGVGGGDLKLGAAIGAFLGWKPALLTFGLAVVAGAVVGSGLILARIRQRGEYIPFGPFLVVCGLAVMLFPAIGEVVRRAFWAWWNYAAGSG